MAIPAPGVLNFLQRECSHLLARDSHFSIEESSSAVIFLWRGCAYLVN